MAKKPKSLGSSLYRSRFRFSLKWLMVGVLLLGCMVGWAGTQYRQSVREQATLNALAERFPEAVIDVWYHSQKSDIGEYNSEPSTPTMDVFKWLSGDCYAFERIAKISISSAKISISSAPRVTMFGGGRPIVHVSDLSHQRLVRFPSLQSLKYLEEIEISIFNLESLDGLSEAKNLRKITLDACGAIKDVSDLAGLTNLSQLEIDSCHSIEDLDGISSLKRLVNVNIFRCNGLQDEGKR